MNEYIQAQLDSAHASRESDVDGEVFTVTGRVGEFTGIFSSLRDDREMVAAGYDVKDTIELSVRHTVLAGAGGALVQGDSLTYKAVAYRVHGEVEHDEIAASYVLIKAGK